jgi:hypothetical protein
MKVSGLLVATAVVLSLPAVARAELIAYDYTAAVVGITDTSAGHTLVPGDIHAGDLITGSFTFDNSAGAAASGGTSFSHGAALMLSATGLLHGGAYTYALGAPAQPNDEIDIFGGTFGFYERGPTVPTSFNPAIPLSHFDFFGITASSPDLSLVKLSLPGGGASMDISDQDTSSTAPYWDISASLTNLEPAPATPEPASLVLFGVGVCGVIIFHRRRATPLMAPC